MVLFLPKSAHRERSFYGGAAPLLVQPPSNGTLRFLWAQDLSEYIPCYHSPTSSPWEGRATVLTYPVLTPANPLPYFLPRRWSPAHSSTQVNLPAREGASQGVESPHSFLLHSFLSGAQILSQFLFSFCPTWFFGGFLALLEVWGLLLAFSGCSVRTVPLVDVL